MTPHLPIYMDYGATNPVDPRVAQAMIPWLTEHFSGSKTRRIHMFLALASVALCLVVVASVANSSKRLSGTVELFDASAESANDFAANKALATGGTLKATQHEMKKVTSAAQKVFNDAVAEQNLENAQEAAFRAGGNDAIDGDTTEFGGSASRAFTYTLNVEDAADEAEQ